MKTKTALRQDGLPKNFLNRFGEHVTGFLHGLDWVLPHTHRYQLTAKGRRIITALLAACYADVEQLTKMAA